jgi:hypothetical protein
MKIRNVDTVCEWSQWRFVTWTLRQWSQWRFVTWTLREWSHLPNGWNDLCCWRDCLCRWCIAKGEDSSKAFSLMSLRSALCKSVALLLWFRQTLIHTVLSVRCVLRLKKYSWRFLGSFAKLRNTTITRWFKYDRDYLCINKSQFVPVIFEPPYTFVFSVRLHGTTRLPLDRFN